MGPLYTIAVREVRIPPRWESATGLWDECLGFFRTNGLDESESYSLAMAAQELLENAVKYGHWRGQVEEEIALSLEVDSRAATIEVQSPIADDPFALRQLDETVQWIRGFQNPFEAHVARLKRLSARGHPEGESGLGLTRVAYEARCILDFYLTIDQSLSMCAVYARNGLY